eukprot:371690_1
MTHSQANVALAFILTCAAGLSTFIGASLVFCIPPSFVDILPISLAFSAGVMIYVSFVDLLPVGLEAFAEDLQHSHPDSFELMSHLYLSLTFFGGILIGYLLDFIVHKLGHDHDLISSEDIVGNQKAKRQRLPSTTNVNNADEDEINALTSPANSLELTSRDVSDSDVSVTDEQATVDVESKNLIKTSLITALAIGLHNFPEGLATFVSTLADPTLGVSIAVAISIHNIPEGVAIATPIYVATQSKCKAFLWAFTAGIAEPIGGLVGFAIMNMLFSEFVFGVAFGFTAGIMIYISFRELLPTARKRDTT